MTRVSFDLAVRLLIGSPGEGSSEIAAYAAYEISGSTNQHVVAHAQHRDDKDILGAVRLLNAAASRVAISQAGQLIVSGENWVFTAETDHQHEPWDVVLWNGYSAIGLPGGDFESPVM